MSQVRQSTYSAARRLTFELVRGSYVNKTSSHAALRPFVNRIAAEKLATVLNIFPQAMRTLSQLAELNRNPTHATNTGVIISGMCSLLDDTSKSSVVIDREPDQEKTVDPSALAV